MFRVNGFRGAGILTTSAIGLSLVFGTSPAFGQVRERDVTVTGPRGRTLERDLKSQVGPNGIDRQTIIRRPSGTFERDVHISRPQPPGGVWGGGFGPRPPVRSFVERDVYFGGGGYRGGGGLNRAESFGLGAALGTGAGLLIGKVFSTPPPAPAYVVAPPVVVAPAPVYVPAPPPVVVYNPPVRLQPQAPPTVVVDPVAQSIGRLSSHHDNSRIEGAYVLGRLGDARAVDPLVDLLKHDKNKDVRIAAATAIGQIGDPRSAIILERATIYDKKQEVRDAAALALSKMPKVVPAGGVAPGSGSSASPNDLRPLGAEQPESVPPPPTPSGHVSTTRRP